MTRSTDIEKPNDQAFAAHEEYAGDHALAVLTAPVRYDTGQPRDITKSPYVFGAALLASSGGFSCDYGMYDTSRCSECFVNLPASSYPRSRRHLNHSSHDPFPGILPQTHPDSPG